MREKRERKCCGCRCIKERVRVTPKPYSGRLTTISTGDFGDGMAKGSRDDAISSGSSNLVGDSFLQEAVQIKSGSSSVGNFAKKVVETIFQPGELEGRKCY